MSNNTQQPEELATMRYERTLEELYTQTDIPATLTWNNVQARRTRNVLQGKKSTREPAWLRSSSSSFKAKRLATIVAAMLLLAILGGSAYASGIFDPIITNMLQGDASSNTLLDKGMFTNINQTSRDGNVTGTLEAAYADSNTLILGISVDHSKIPGFNATKEDWEVDAAKVTTSDGVKLVSTGLTTTAGGADEVLGKNNKIVTVNPNNTSAVLYFNDYQVQGNPTSLRIHAEFNYYCTDVSGNTNSFKCSSPAARTHDYNHPYKLSYDFTVPFHTGYIVNVNKTVTSHGKAVTLQSMVVTPSGTRLYIHGLTYFEMSPHWYSLDNDDTRLTIGDQIYHHLHLLIMTDPNVPDTYIFIPQNKVSAHQTCTLHILDPRHGPGWTFTFTM